MQFKLQPAEPQADPHDVIVAQLRALAPRMAQDPFRVDVTPAAPPEPASESSAGATPLNDNTGDIYYPPLRARSGRGIALLIVCAGIAATAAWHFYGEEAKQRLSHLVPQLLADASALTQSANTAGTKGAAPQISEPQPTAEPVPAQEGAAAPATPAEAVTPSTAAAAEEALPTQAALPPEFAQSIETMTREIASLKQTIEQLQADQQQLSRDVAKVAGQEVHRKLAAPASKPSPLPRPQRASTPARAARPLAPPPPQTYSQGQPTQGVTQREAYIAQPAVTQLPPQPGDTSVPRPPMPLR